MTDCRFNLVQHIFTMTTLLTVLTCLWPSISTAYEDDDALRDGEANGERGRSMSVIGKILAVMDMESHDVKMESI